jgi:hypothetical protein
MAQSMERNKGFVKNFELISTMKKFLGQNLTPLHFQMKPMQKQQTKGAAAYRLQSGMCNDSARNGAGCTFLQPVGLRREKSCLTGQ